jgi:hypothetical protein
MVSFGDVCILLRADVLFSRTVLQHCAAFGAMAQWTFWYLTLAGFQLPILIENFPSSEWALTWSFKVLNKVAFSQQTNQIQMKVETSIDKLIY